MSLESTGARCEQMAQHMLIHGTPFDPAEIVRRIEAVDDAAIGRVVARWRAAPPTLAALGPLEPARGFRPAAGPARRLSERPRTDGAATQDLPPPVSGPRGAVSAGRRPGLPAPARARRLRGMGEPARPLARFSCAVGADLAARRAEPSELSGAARPLRRGLAHRPGLQFLHLRTDDEALAGGIGLSNMRRGVAETASLGYWVGEPFARQRYMTRGAAAGPRFRLRPAAAAPASRPPACRPTCRAARCCCAPASSRKATPATTC